MTNGNHGHGAAVAGRGGGVHLTPEGHLEEILHSITGEEEANFQDHLEYLSPQNRARMRYEQFVTVQGGTEKIFDDVYHNAYRVATEKNLKGKADPKAVADTLELVVVEGLKRINGSVETHLWKNFEAMKANNSFRSDDDRLSHLVVLASYLGADQQEIGQLLAGLRTSDPLQWNQSVRDFTNKLKDGVIDFYMTRHRNRLVNAENEHKFKAYAAKHMRETHGVEPRDILRYLSPQTQVEQALLPITQLAQVKNPQAYAALGVKEYKPANQAAAHGGH